MWHLSLFAVMAAVLVTSGLASAQETRATSSHVYRGPEGRLVYATDAQGDCIPDFSNCGYSGGDRPIPDVPVVAQLAPSTDGSDDTQRIQAAVDRVGSMPLRADGFRGTLLLERGEYRVSGQLALNQSGVVLRGEGDVTDGTIIRIMGREAREAVTIGGPAGPMIDAASEAAITDAYVPVGARSFTLVEGHGFEVGDSVIVTRVGNAAWITEIGMDRIPEHPQKPGNTVQWKPFDLPFDRVVTAVDGRQITIDAPIVCAIDARWGGGHVARYADPGRISNVGIEDLLFVSEFDRARRSQHEGKSYFSDEDHATYALRFGNAKNCWARRITTRYMAHGPAHIDRNAKWVTLEACRSMEPVSKIEGGRRYPYLFSGQLSLIRDCYSDGARHAFVVHARVCGPNVFLRCRSERDYACSEPHHRWSVGGLYDNVEVASAIAVQDRTWMGTGHGWAGANYVLWNCRGGVMINRPPTANNWAIGFVGSKWGPYVKERPAATWDSFGEHVTPESLYEAQLRERLAK